MHSPYTQQELSGDEIVIEAMQEVVVDEDVPYHHIADAESRMWRSK
jgi:hypothetical protein